MPYTIVALVSGKGGAGKTTIATNLAWIVSKSLSRVLILDLDFHNHGATGLFSSRYDLGVSDVLSLLKTAEDASHKIDLTAIHDSLFFLPAAQPASEPDLMDPMLLAPDELRKRLHALLVRLHRQLNIDCFVLDCHGGIDATSVAAAGISDTVLVITEADTITFSGTLSLIETYYQAYKNSVVKPKLEYVVNRIPAKYNWRDLSQVYKRILKRGLGTLSAREEVLSFIPNEEYVAESFGDYPFQVQLAPRALFTSKIELIAYKLFRHTFSKLLPAYLVGRFDNPRFAKKVDESIVSSQTRSVRTVFSAYAVGSLYMALAALPAAMVNFLNATETSMQRSTLSFFASILWALEMPVFVFFGVAALRVATYFREKVRFERAYLRVTIGDRRHWGRIALWKWRMLYMGSLVPLIIIGFWVMSVVLAWLLE